MMKCRVEMLGGYHVAIYGGDYAVAITSPDNVTHWVKGDDAPLLVAEFDELTHDIRHNPNSRAARIGVRGIAEEMLSLYFN